MALAQAHRQYLIRDQMIGPFVINFVLNAGIAWLMFGNLGHLSVSGDPGAIGDLIVTMFALTFLICVIATPLVRKLYTASKIPALASKDDVPGWIMKLPGNLLARAVLCALVVALITAPVIIGFFTATGWSQVSATSYTLGKGLLCGVIAVLVSPPLALRAMADAAERAVLPLSDQPV